jgi:ketosteroid isomerase-like protein
MSDKKAAVEAYFEGFRRTDRARILALLTEDVVWDLPGYKHLEGKAEFDGEDRRRGVRGIARTRAGSAHRRGRHRRRDRVGCGATSER